MSICLAQILSYLKPRNAGSVCSLGPSETAFLHALMSTSGVDEVAAPKMQREMPIASTSGNALHALMRRAGTGDGAALARHVSIPLTVLAVEMQLRNGSAAFKPTSRMNALATRPVASMWRTCMRGILRSPIDERTAPGTSHREERPAS